MKLLKSYETVNGAEYCLTFGAVFGAAFAVWDYKNLNDNIVVLNTRLPQVQLVGGCCFGLLNYPEGRNVAALLVVILQYRLKRQNLVTGSKTLTLSHSS